MPLKSGDSSVPTFLGPATEICLAFVGGHDEGEAIVCAKARLVELAAQVGNDLLVVRVVCTFICG